MKKSGLLLFIGFVFSVQILCAQDELPLDTLQVNLHIKEVKTFIGITTGLNFENTTYTYSTIVKSGVEGKLSLVDLNPKIGLYLTKSLVLGLNIPIYNYSYDDYFNDAETTVSDYSINMFSRLFYNYSNIKPYVEISGGFGRYNRRYAYLQTDSVSTFEARTLTFYPSVGCAFFVKDYVAFDFTLSYELRRLTPTGYNPYNYRALDKSFQCRLGVIIVLSKSK